jgi:four helix bundle suffix protein
MDNKDFIRQDNNYRTLKAFQKAECVYDVTYYFANKFLQKGDRTIDQMVQAARSGKQNLAEGNIDGVASKEMEIKLTNANIAITLIHQCDVLIKGLIEWQKKNFLENGGIKEEMYRARKAYRDSNGFNRQNRSNGQNKY